MSLANELHPALYKNFLFYVVGSKTTGGQKDVRHSFPGSNKQTIENLGVAPRVFELNAVISGDDYFSRKDTFLNLLEDSEPGVLIHPFFGRLEDYVARTFVLNESMNQLGYAEIKIVFEVSNDIGVPSKASVTASEVAASNEAFMSVLEGDFTDKFGVTTGFFGNFTAALDKINGVIDTINEKTSFLSAAADQINAFSAQITNFSSNITSLIKNPLSLVTSISGLFTSIGNIYPTAKATFDVLKGLFSFGDGDEEIKETTSGLSERKQNNKIVNGFVKSAALGHAYVAASNIEFDTVDEIDKVAADLEEQFNKVYDEEDISPESKQALSEVRVITQQLLDEKRLIAAQLVDVRTNTTSVRLLAYKYYGNTDKAKQIIAINDIEDVNFVSGDVRVVSV